MRATRAPAAPAKKTATTIAKAVSEKQAGRVSVLDLRGLVGYTDFVVICQAQNERQAKAIADHVVETMAAAGRKPFVTEGYENASWILLDYSDVIAHVFLPDVRDFYDLDGLWADAPKVALEEGAAGGAPRAAAKRPAARKPKKA